MTTYDNESHMERKLLPVSFMTSIPSFSIRNGFNCTCKMAISLPSI